MIMKSNPIRHFDSYFEVMRYTAMIMVMLVLTTIQCMGAEPDLAVPAAKVEDTNSLETLRTYLQLQEQLHATQLAIEENRKEATAAAARNAEALATRLQAIEQALVLQRTRDLEAVQSSNRMMLIAAGAVGALGFLAMLLMSYSHWRAMNRLAEIASGFPANHGLGNGRSVAALGPGEGHVVTVGPAEESNGRLLGAIDRLEKRIYELEHTAHAPLQEGTSSPASSAPTNSDANSVRASMDVARVGVLLGKGESLLSMDKPEEALGCFEEILALNPNHTEALVKKGTALERLRKLDEAINCYDRAIAADSSMTIAYLHKGGLFNRMERFSEALECYEQALRSQRR